jgi:ketosteroid isomerase-like protein
MSDPTSDLLDRFFAAIVAGDLETVEAIYADDVEVWHNVTGQVMDKAANAKLLGFWHASVADMAYEILERHTYEGGASQRHVVRGKANGQEIAAEVAILFHVADGQITKIFEYLDPAAVAAVFDRS